ncbi:serine hydrolase domain-containing protein [Actinoplanes sp. NPDC023936]|uniref:serine hydrolase domain-containing protein n=1 Tax=Actinoplanes sp. NPDC023936 TaxID=3154910 RepID=UPI0033FCA6C3
MTATLTRPPTAGRLDLDDISATIDAEMRAARVPGLALAVIAGGEVVHAGGYGVTSADSPMPVTGDTLFRLASVTKILTGVAIMRLVESGRLDLDRPLAEDLPRLRLRRPGLAGRITLRMLLSHTSGLPEGSVERPWRQERREWEGLGDHVHDDLRRLPSVGEPGELYYYSNLGINLAGYLAQEVTGTPFPRLLDELVIQPLGMERTTLDPTVAMTYPLAQRHRLDEAGRLRVRRDGGDNCGFHPSGYAFSTVADTARVLQLHLAGGVFAGQRLLRPETVREMQRPHVDLLLARPLGYGLTWLIEPSYKGIRRVGHEGVLRGYCAKVVFAPREGAGVVLFYNHEYNETPRFFAARERIIDAVFDRVLGLPDGPATAPGPPTGSFDPRWAGEYGQILGTGTAELSIRDGRPHLRYGPAGDGVTVPLRQTRPGAYESVLADRELPAVPWPRTPYLIIDRVSVGIPSGSAGYIAVNGQPYRRLSGPGG